MPPKDTFLLPTPIPDGPLPAPLLPVLPISAAPLALPDAPVPKQLPVSIVPLQPPRPTEAFLLPMSTPLPCTLHLPLHAQVPLIWPPPTPDDSLALPKDRAFCLLQDGPLLSLSNVACMLLTPTLVGPQPALVMPISPPLLALPLPTSAAHVPKLPVHMHLPFFAATLLSLCTSPAAAPTASPLVAPVSVCQSLSLRPPPMPDSSMPTPDRRKFYAPQGGLAPMPTVACIAPSPGLPSCAAFPVSLSAPIVRHLQRFAQVPY